MMRSLAVLCCGCVLLCAVSAGAAPADTAREKKAEVRIGVILPKAVILTRRGMETARPLAPTRLRFLAVNTGDKEIITTPLGTSGNRFVFITPDGKEVPRGISVLIGPEGLIHIKPGESHAWEMEDVGSLVAIMDSMDFKAPGWYGLYWSFEGEKSNTLSFYKEE